MPRAACRAPVERRVTALRRARLPSPLGDLLATTAPDGTLHALAFDNDAEATAEPPSALADALAGYFAGDLAALDALPVAPAGSDFQHRVWALLRSIPPGATRSYGDLARQLGQPGAARAVGLANGANPIAIVIPCHRVIGANGTLTGYAAGMARKAWLLRHEGVLPALLV
jgi:O-6-methylguanine DNA methyltransferase